MQETKRKVSRKLAKDIFDQIEQNQLVGFLSILVVNEIVWILEHFYNLKRKDYIPYLLRLLLLKNIKIKEIKKELLLSIIKKLENSTQDFTDIYLFFISDTLEIKTFDKNHINSN